MHATVGHSVRDADGGFTLAPMRKGVRLTTGVELADRDGPPKPCPARARSASILSAYRTPETNAMLERTTFGVAENSQRLYGRALDIRLGTRLAEAMLAARAMQRGGVGWYP